jgi:hypothetical protein
MISLFSRITTMHVDGNRFKQYLPNAVARPMEKCHLVPRMSFEARWRQAASTRTCFNFPPFTISNSIFICHPQINHQKKPNFIYSATDSELFSKYEEKHSKGMRGATTF